MRRWNGWGDEEQDYPLSKTAAMYLDSRIAPGHPTPDATMAEVIATIPESRMTGTMLVSIEPVDRLRHARGQSLPDWVAMRSGRVGIFPDGVAYPATVGEVRDLIQFARNSGSQLIPYGGGTSVTGHITPLAGDRPVVTVDLSRLNRLIAIDEESRTATFEAGVNGPHLEAQLENHGLTLGHFPQSFEYSTLGGWIATRSCGQQSYHYGRIEGLLLGAGMESPIGPLELPVFPASAAGPDIREMLLGSEGRLGMITRATVRVRPIPQAERFKAIFFHDWPSGLAAVRKIAQERLPVSMIRLSDALETETTLTLAGRDSLVRWADRGLRWLKYGPERCLLIFGVTGNATSVSRVSRQVVSLARKEGGLPVGAMIGEQWRKNRFRTPYLRNTLWQHGCAVDTLETAVPWTSVSKTSASIKECIRQALEELGERALIMAHLSHVYENGASIYVTIIFRRSADPEQTLHHWRSFKHAASQAIVANGGTISHQHGVGLDHLPYLPAEKGEIGLRLLESACKSLDPQGLMNPGKLFSAK